ncbi:MAG: hypothetical protein O2890_05125 [Cyanobacteria bacterium]|nr:hypothetical protein [Cyanobacteriota bacterium]MDA0865788.1 hypothetical protein [Cyanobacteriota bacterium]
MLSDFLGISFLRDQKSFGQRETLAVMAGFVVMMVLDMTLG